MSLPATTPAQSSGRRRSKRGYSGTETSSGRAPRSTRFRISGPPRNPAPPVTRIFFPANPLIRLELQGDGEALGGEDLAALAGRREARVLQVGIDHDPHELPERHLRLPAERPLRLRGVGAQVLDLGGPEIFRVDLHVLLPVEARVGERLLEELLHRVRLAGADDEIIPAIVLQDAPHRLDVFEGEPPVATGVEVA